MTKKLVSLKHEDRKKAEASYEDISSSCTEFKRNYSRSLVKMASWKTYISATNPTCDKLMLDCCPAPHS